MKLQKFSVKIKISHPRWNFKLFKYYGSTQWINYVSALILFSLFGFSQDEISLDNETLSIFDGVISYDQKMNDLNNLVANREQAILRGDYGHSKEKKKHC